MTLLRAYLLVVAAPAVALTAALAGLPAGAPGDPVLMVVLLLLGAGAANFPVMVSPRYKADAAPAVYLAAVLLFEPAPRRRGVVPAQQSRDRASPPAAAGPCLQHLATDGRRRTGCTRIQVVWKRAGRRGPRGSRHVCDQHRSSRHRRRAPQRAQPDADLGRGSGG